MGAAAATDGRRRVLLFQSRHQLFPQVFRYVDEYVRRKVNLQRCAPCELGLEKYVKRIVERLRDGIVPDDSEGEPPLMPILNRYKPIGTTAEVDFKTTRPCHATTRATSIRWCWTTWRGRRARASGWSRAMLLRSTLATITWA